MENKSAMNGLLGKLYDIMSAADQAVPNAVPRKFTSSQEKPFVSYCTPGFPLDDLDFGNLTTQDQVNRCSFFSQFVNSIPAPSGTWQLTNDKSWDIYELALRQVRLPVPTLSDREEQILKRAEAFVREEVEVTDPFTLETKREVRNTMAVQMYDRLFTAYAAAVRRMNNSRISAITNPTPENVLDWTNNGPLYEQEAFNAYSNWGSAGYRDYVTQANGIIANLMGRGSFALYDRMRAQYAGAAKKDLLGNTFYPTFAYPPKIIGPEFDGSWTKFSFSSREVSTFESKESKSWGGGVGTSFGLWSFGASASYSEERTHQKADVDEFELFVDLIQVPILRPWMTSWIFSSRGWKGLNELNQPGSISTGQHPLGGFMPILPTSMIVARNLRVNTNMESVDNKTFKSETNASARVGWGPFSLRGNYSSSSQSASHNYSSDSTGMTCRGAQVIAFVCDVLPLSPDPDPALDFPDEFRGLLDFKDQAEMDRVLRGLEIGKWLSLG